MTIQRFGMAFAAALALAAGPHAAAQTLSIGSAAQGSLAYASAAAIAKLAGEKGVGQIRVIPQGGPTVLLPLVSAGEMNMSVGVSPTVVFAYTGGAEFKGRPQKNLRVIATLFPLRFGFYVRADSGIKSIADLKGKRIGTEFRKQRVLEVFSRATLAGYGLSLKDVTGVPSVDLATNIQDFNAGRIDAAYAAIGSGLVAQSNASVGGIRWLPVEDKPEILAKIREIAPGIFIETIKPARHLVGVPAPMPVTSAPYVLVGNDKLSDEMVGKLVRAIHANQPALAASVAAYRGFDPKQMAKDLGVPYHRAAENFYKSVGIWPTK